MKIRDLKESFANKGLRFEFKDSNNRSKPVQENTPTLVRYRLWDSSQTKPQDFFHGSFCKDGSQA